MIATIVRPAERGCIDVSLDTYHPTRRKLKIEADLTTAHNAAQTPAAGEATWSKASAGGADPT
jgi:hypothetical protein